MGFTRNTARRGHNSRMFNSSSESESTFSNRNASSSTIDSINNSSSNSSSENFNNSSLSSISRSLRSSSRSLNSSTSSFSSVQSPSTSGASTISDDSTTTGTGSTTDGENNNLSASVMIINDEDDVIFIPENVERVNIPNNLRNQVIDITDSPEIAASIGPVRLSSSKRNSDGPYSQKGRKSKTNAASTTVSVPESPASTSQASAPKEPGIQSLECPICFESLRKRNPISTICGHVFCKECIEAAFAITYRSCPICKKPVPKKNGYHNIFLG